MQYAKVMWQDCLCQAPIAAVLFGKVLLTPLHCHLNFMTVHQNAPIQKKRGPECAMRYVQELLQCAAFACELTCTFWQKRLTGLQ